MTDAPRGPVRVGSLLPPVFFRLRSARKQDAAEICALLVRSVSEICARDYPPEHVKFWNSNKTPARVEGWIADRANYFVVAQDESGKLIGAGNLRETDGVLMLLYLLPEAVGKGVGKALLANLLQRARDGGHREVRLESTITSLPFYEKAGFRVIGACLERAPPHGVPCYSMLLGL